ncbi:mucin-2 [Engraulis encrasicolus]|uniref:mucin-2 n=1 Tax=Engraulis encrasicolus TaxID=184585 RepID=UPI002FD58149
MPSQLFCGRTPELLIAMDVQVQPSLHCRVNGGHDPSVGARAQIYDDDALKHLSLEEKECLLFFEETIDSLEDGFQDNLDQVDGAVSSSGSNTPVEGLSPVSAPQSPIQASTPVPPHLHSPRDNDIIDLVHPPPSDHMVFPATMPDFQSLAVAPETHFEMKAKRDHLENFPSEYQHLPQASSSSMPSAQGQDGGSVGGGAPGGGGGYQPPPGSVPTPVVIAQKLAENQGENQVLLPSMLAKRRRSLETTTRVMSPPSPVAEQPGKQGPPTSTKPTINVNHHMVAVAAVNAAQERRAQALANLGAGAPHPMEGGEPPCRRNLPTRSVSFRDSAPEKSHMEALSKLGLVRTRAKSITPTVEATNEPDLPLAKPKSPTPTPIGTTSTSSSSSSSSSSSPSPTLKAEIHTDFNRFGGKSTVVTPSPMTSTTPDVPASFIVPPSADVVSRDFNSFGGKTITVIPAASNSPPPSARTTPPPPKADAPAFETNSTYYGGRTKTIIPASALARADVPDGSVHTPRTHTPSPPSTIRGEIPNAPTPTPTVPTATSNSIGHYGCKSKVITPTLPATALPKVVDPPAQLEAPAPRPDVQVTRGNSFGSRTPVVVPMPGMIAGGTRGTKSATLPPTAPKPANPHRTTRLPSSPPPEPEPRRSSISSKPGKPSFRSQGITVQFSGRGATDESRREALRKLGLLKDTKDMSLL